MSIFDIPVPGIPLWLRSSEELRFSYVSALADDRSDFLRGASALYAH